jgi:hypothetical protein
MLDEDTSPEVEALMSPTQTQCVSEGIRSTHPERIESATMSEAGNAVDSTDPHTESMTSLEQRVHRLEDAVATLQDTRQLEERVVERLSRSAPVAAALPPPPPDSAGLLIDVGRRMLPAAVDVIQNEAATADAQARQGARTTRPAWFLVEVYAEARAMFHMYVDRRYRMTWVGRVVPLVLLGAILTSLMWFPFLSTLYTMSAMVGILLMKPIDLILAYFLFHVLRREACRYRETVPDLPPGLRA